MRYIFGPVEEVEEEVYINYLMNQILLVIKVKRFEWAGHVTRVSKNRRIKKVFDSKSEGTRKAERQD